MTSGDDSTQEIRSALRAWEAAEDAYREAMTLHIATWWGDEGPPAQARPLQPLTVDELERIADLRANVERTEAAYRDAARRFSTGG
jgi:hypothetical protein